MNKLDSLAGKLYEVYCEKVGGVAFNGDPLPDWNHFRSDEKKVKQSNAWLEVAKTAEYLLK